MELAMEREIGNRDGGGWWATVGKGGRRWSEREMGFRWSFALWRELGFRFGGK